jgi:hypothetical protein
LIWRKAVHPTAQYIPRDFGANAWRVLENPVSSHGLVPSVVLKIRITHGPASAFDLAQREQE